MSKIANRLYAVVAIVLAAYAVNRLVQAETEPPEVEWPNWTVRELPVQLGNWHGEETKLDPRVAIATGADVIVNRTYEDDSGHTVSLHTAMFEDPATGVYHSPLNCYRAAGWKQVGETREKLQIAENLFIPVRLTTWKREDDKIQVLDWFQLGRHTLYGRSDLGLGVRWSMRGQPTWPVLIKIMVQAPLTDSEDSKTVAVSFTQQLAKWLNQPEHRKYLDRWGGV